MRAAQRVGSGRIARTLLTTGQVDSESQPGLAPINSAGPGGRNGALMIGGGAALVVGSEIGGDAGTLMMVGGGVVGLVGIQRYLQ